MNLMKDWYVDQPDKSLSIQISIHPDGTYGIGGYLRLYTLEAGGDRGSLITEIHLRGSSTPPEAGTGGGSESGSSSGDSSVLEVQDLPPPHALQGAQDFLADQGLESEDTQQLLADLEAIQRGAPGHLGLRSRQEPRDANESDQA